jgi:hypothetical protein
MGHNNTIAFHTGFPVLALWHEYTATVQSSWRQIKSNFAFHPAQALLLLLLGPQM